MSRLDFSTNGVLKVLEQVFQAIDTPVILNELLLPFLFHCVRNLYRKLNPQFQSLAEIVMPPESEEPVLPLRTGKKDPDSAFALTLSLEQEEPSIHCNPSRTEEGLVIINAYCLKFGDTEFIANRLNFLLTDVSTL